MAAPMITQHAFLRKTRKGKVLKVVRQHYLRDDVATELEEALLAHPAAFWVVDAHVVLSRIDILENAKIQNVVVLQTVLELVRARSIGVFHRLRALVKDPTRRFHVFANEHARETFVSREAGESADAYALRSVHAAAQWLQERFAAESDIQTPLVTAARGARDAAAEAGVAEALTLREAVRTQFPDDADLMDMLPDDEDASGGDASSNAQDGESSSESDWAYPIRPDGSVRFAAHYGAERVREGVSRGALVEGVIRLNPYNPLEGWVAVSTGSRNRRDERPNDDEGIQGSREDILIQGIGALNRAMDGDTVALELLPESFWSAPSDRLVDRDTADAEATGAGSVQKPSTSLRRRTGRIVAIVRRRWRPYCCTADEATVSRAVPGGVGASVLVTPADRRVPRIRIKTRQARELAGQRLVVCVDTWEATSRFPSGHYVRRIGPAGDPDVESEVILIEHEVRTAPFSANVLECVPPLPWRVHKEDLAGRRDARELRVFSVDPPGCRDIDDAMHVRDLGDGLVELGVHIADVSHFVRPATAADDEAARRCTTVYLVDRRIDMLPKPLTEDICSLRSGVERFAFSVYWTVERATARVVNVAFSKSVIRSVAALTYADAQRIKDDAGDTSPLAHDIRTIYGITEQLREARIARGALTLASNEVKFALDEETRRATDVAQYEHLETNHMVEELMLLANTTVAEEILRAFPRYAVLRRHPPPSAESMETLTKTAAAVGIKIDASTSRHLQESLDLAVREGRPAFNRLIRVHTTRCMNQAVYFCTGNCAADQYGHYGLAAKLYTHFTSPIRRYADVLVHRLLAASLGIDPLPANSMDVDRIVRVCDEMNTRHRNAQLAGRASTELHTLLFFRDKEVEETGYITRVRANGVVVLVPKYGIETILYLVEKGKASPFVLDEGAHCISGKGIKLQIFDSVRVRIAVAEPHTHRQRLELLLVSPRVPGAPCAAPAGGAEAAGVEPELTRAGDPVVEMPRGEKRKKTQKDSKGAKSPKRRKK